MWGYVQGVCVSYAANADWCSGDRAPLSTLVTDDSTLAGPTLQPLDKNDPLGLGRTLVTAFLTDRSTPLNSARKEGTKSIS